MTEEAPQRKHSLRKKFNSLRYIARSGAPWRMMPHDLPPWDTACRRRRDGTARLIGLFGKNTLLA
jgi:transposase